MHPEYNTESYTPDRLLYNTDGLRTGEETVLTGQGTLARGSVLARDSGNSDKLVLVDSASGTTSITAPVAILAEEADTSSGDVEQTASAETRADGNGQGDGGEVTVSADATNIARGETAATSGDDGGTGGDVALEGERVGITDMVDASGHDGGGSIRVGGGKKGDDPTIDNAESTFVGEHAHLTADATGAGDGGEVIVWSDGTTRSYGEVSARGGPEGGDGGFAEVSGENLDTSISLVDVGAPLGEPGTALFDPDTIEIVGGGVSGTSGGSADGEDGDGTDGLDDSDNVEIDEGDTDNDGTVDTASGPDEILLDDTDASDPSTNDSTFEVTETELENASNNVVLEARSSITSSGTFGDSGTNGTNDLTVSGGHNLTLRTRNATASVTGANTDDNTGQIDLTGIPELVIDGGGNLTVRAGSSSSDLASDVNLSDTFTDNGGSIDVTANFGDITVDALTASGGGSIKLEAIASGTNDDQQVTLGGAVDPGTGDASVFADDITIDTGNGDAINAGGQTVTLSPSVADDTNDAISLGNSDSLGNNQLELSAGEVNAVEANELQVGSMAVGGKLNVANSINITSDSSINALSLITTGRLTINNTLTVGDSSSGDSTNVTLESGSTGNGSGDILINASVDGDGTNSKLHFRPTDDSTPIQVANTGITDALNIDGFSNLTEGLSELVFGSASQSDQVTYASGANDVSWKDSINLKAGSGSVVIDNAVDTTSSSDAASVTVTSSNSTTLGQNITTDGGVIDFGNAADVGLSNGGTINLTSEDGSGDDAAGLIDFTGTAIDANTDGSESLVVDASSASGNGNVNLSSVGTGAAVGELRVITGATTTLGGNITTDASSDTGDVNLSNATGGIVLDKSANSTVAFDVAGALNSIGSAITNINDDESLSVTANKGVIVSSLDLSGSTTDGELRVTVDADNNASETLQLTGSVANVALATLEGDGASHNETVDIDADVTTTSGALTIRSANQVTLDASAARSLTAATALDISTNVGGIELDGGASEVALASNGDSDISLASVTDDGVGGTAADLTLIADGGVVLPTVSLDDTTDGSLSVTVDNNDNEAQTLTHSGGITNVNDVTFSGGGTGTNDTIDIDADITTTGGALTVEDAATVQVSNVTLTGEGGVDFSDTDIATFDLDGAGVVSFVSPGGDVDLSGAAITDSANISELDVDASASGAATLPAITLDNGGGDLLDVGASANATLEGDASLAGTGGLELDDVGGDVVLATGDDTTATLSTGGSFTSATATITATNANAEDATITADGGATVGAVDLGGSTTDGELRVTVDADNNASETLQLTGSVANVALATLEGDGASHNETVDIDADVTTTSGALTIRSANQVTLDASAARSLTAATALDISTNVGGIELDGGASEVALASNGDSDISLASVTDDGVGGTAADLTLIADGGVVLPTVSLDDTTDGSLSVTVDNNDNEAQTLTHSGGITNVNDVTFSGGGTGTNDRILLDAAVTTTGGGQAYEAPVELGKSVTLQENGTGDIVFDAGVNASSTGAEAMTVDAASSDVFLSGAVGNGVKLASLRVVNAGTIALEEVNTVSSQEYIAAGTITLNGQRYSATGSVGDDTIRLDGDIELATDAEVRQQGGEAADDLVMAGNINGDGNGPWALDVSVSGGGAFEAQAPMGDQTPLGALFVQRAQAVTLDDVITQGRSKARDNSNDNTEHVTIDVGVASAIDGLVRLNGDQVTDGAGAGSDTGSVRINASDRVEFDPEPAGSDSSGSHTIRTADGGNGAAGDIVLTGGALFASVTSFEDGGNLNAADGDGIDGRVDRSGVSLGDFDHLIIDAAALTVGDTTVGANDAGVSNALELNARSGDLTLTGNLDTTGEQDSGGAAGSIALSASGQIVLNDTDGTVEIVSGDARSGGDAGDDERIRIDSAVEPATAGDDVLELDAGGAEVVIAGPAGQTDRLGRLEALGDRVDIDESITAETVEVAADLEAGIVEIADGATVSSDTTTIKASSDVIVGGTLTERSSGGGSLAIDFGQDDMGGKVDLSAATLAYDGADFRRIDGGAGEDTLIGRNGGRTLRITGTNEGTIAGGDVAFGADTGVENVEGGSGDDTFRFTDSGVLTGSTGVAGHGGSDTLEGSASGDTFEVTATDAGTLDTGAGTTDFETVENAAGRGGDDTFSFTDTGRLKGSIGIAGNGGGDTIEGSPEADTLTIASSDGGSLTTGAGTTGFETVENLSGRGEDDTFVFGLSGALSGVIDGGANATSSPGDQVDYSNRNGPVSRVLGTDLVDIETVTGSTSGDDTLGGVSSATIDGTDAGQANGGVAFTGVENLAGTGGGDTFTFAAGGELTGSTGVDGDGGSDTLRGSTGDDVFATTAANAGMFETGAGVTAYAAVENLSGRGGGDVFDLGHDVTGAGVFGAGGADQFNVDGSIAADLFGGSASDTVAIGDTFTLSGAFDGGGGSDTLDGSAYTSAVDVTVTGDGSSDGLAGTTAVVDGGFDNVDDVLGPGSGSRLTGTADADDFSTTGVDAGVLTLASGRTTSYSGFGELAGDANDDTFTLDHDVTGGVFGEAGADDFLIDGGVALSGNIDGGSGTDTLDASAYTTAATFDLTGAGGTDGASGATSGTPNPVGAGFDDIDVFEGGAAGDTFNVTTTVAADVRGNGGDDVFSLASGETFSGHLALGRGSDEANVSGTLDGALRGGAGDDTFVLNGDGVVVGVIDGAGESGGDTLDISSTTSARTLTLDGSGFTNIEALQGSGDRLQGGASNDLAWDLVRSSGGSVTLPSTQSIAFDGFDTIRTNGGTNTFTADGDYAGTVRLTAQRNVWDYTAGATLTTGQVTGGGGLLVAEPASGAGSDLTIGPSDLDLPNVTGLTGPLVIGGSLEPLSLPLTGDQTVAVNTDRLTVASAFETGGGLALLGSNVALDASPITVGGQVNLVAAGSTCNGCAGGLSGVGEVILEQQAVIEAQRGAIVANQGIRNSEDLVLNLGDGALELAVDESQREASQPSQASQFRSVALTTELDGFIDVLGLDLVGIQINLVNPAAQTVGIEDVSSLDLSAFEEDLTLFGRVGRGVALSLAQCEQVDGCAPSVTLDEIEASMAAVDERIKLLEQRLEQASAAGKRERVERLIERYRAQREQLVAQREELENFLEGGGSKEGVAEQFEEQMPEPVDQKTLDTLINMVENMYTRVSFLESLLTSPERRQELAKRLDMELSQERLKRIIDDTMSAIDHVESLVERMSKGGDVGTVQKIRRRLREQLNLDLPTGAANNSEPAPSADEADGNGTAASSI